MTFPNLRRKINAEVQIHSICAQGSQAYIYQSMSWPNCNIAFVCGLSLGTRVSSNNKKTLEAHNPATLQLELQTFLHNYDEHLVSAVVGGSKVAAPYRYVARITIFNSYFQAQFFPQRCQRTGHWNLRYPFYRIELFQSALRCLKKLAQRLVIKSG